MNTQAPARSMDRAQSHDRPDCTTIPCPSAPAATDTRDHRPLTAVARYRKVTANRQIDRLWLDLIVFLFCVGALISVAVGAPIAATAAAIRPTTGGRMPEAMSAQDNVIPLYVPEAGGGCSLAVNPVFLGSEARRDIEKSLGKQVFLELFVKVRPKWRDNDIHLREYGY